ncbi:LuxR C-terminal-related transcriptional regulator [Arcobacter sp. F2176]|uniref:helix-turn-helix transcriptional regulator n=1 Tax=Arcobacter sp. F2176 TaxID=2044511 RepID=UPI00100ACD1A|nr:LuxR C-terminal-related transcriptional regulator [Arcobacter sp. F2176]RXJ81248.1 helix-turn-helix transcriptional regulator [Arcobacter sp. F2176]
MKNIILFTNMSSVSIYWNKSLPSLYNAININDLTELTTYLNKNNSPIILMLDELSISNIQEVLEEITKYQFLKVLLFNSVPEVYHASLLLSSGIRGYENSYLASINLENMLKVVEDEKMWIFTDLTNFIINKHINITSSKEPEFMKLLTEKEKEIALMIADGLSNKEIAQKEKNALSTIKGHIKSIFEKVGVNSRLSLALLFK